MLSDDAKFIESIDEIWRSIPSLRDIFAGLAMAAIQANSSIDLLEPDELASDAYNIADAMLKRKVMQK